MTIRHVVSWKLATTDEHERAEQAARIKSGLESLPAVIPELRSAEVGVSVTPHSGLPVIGTVAPPPSRGVSSVSLPPRRISQPCGLPRLLL